MPSALVRSKKGEQWFGRSLKVAEIMKSSFEATGMFLVHTEEKTVEHQHQREFSGDKQGGGG